ncbi:MAG: glycosyltransferase, partial [Flavisolibacter sp.]
MMTTFPPRQCGIATYTADLIQAIRQKFTGTFEIQIAALENQSNSYGSNVQHVLETEDAQSYTRLAKQIRNDDRIKLVVLQHEFGLFINFEEELLQLLAGINKKTVVAFHTVLPDPDPPTKRYIQNIAELAQAFIVMTSDAAKILQRDYHVSDEKIRVIPHGTHLVKHTEKTVFKEKYGYSGRKVLSTFGLLSSGKSIETTLLALPKIIEVHPEVMFLIMGKTHPSVVQHEGEKYRDRLISIIDHLNLKDHVTFINQYLPLSSLLEYLQLTDIYLFTSSDPQQAVSGTFSYAMSCGCPVISTPIPHAREVLKNDSGLIIDFGDSENLALHVNILLKDEPLRNRISLNALHVMASTAWENSAIAHVRLFKEVAGFPPKIKYRIPEISLDHINHMTTPFGIIQFAVLDQPETLSGYTLDDNARALIAMAKHYSIFGSGTDLMLIKRYLNFIAFCSQNDGRFLNYVDISKNFTEQNNECNLDDSTGRAIWALGYLLSLQHILPGEIITEAQRLFNKSVVKSDGIHSTRAMAFIIKGLYYANLRHANPAQLTMIEQFADRLVQMFRHEADSEWKWFESYLTYANSLIPEAMLMAWKSTQKEIYRTIALSSFNFLLSKIFAGDRIAVISNKGWMHYGRQTDSSNKGGEQAIDVAYTVMALSEFYDTFK